MIAGYPKGKLERHYFWTEAEAEAAAQKLNVLIRRYGAEGFSMNPAQRYEYGRCVGLLKRLGLTLTGVVEAAVAERKMELEGHKLSEIIDECLELNGRRAKKGEVSVYHIRNLRNSKRIVERTFGNYPVAQITKRDIIRWLDSLDMSAPSRDFYRRHILTFLSFAVDRGYIKENPARGISKIGQEGEIGIFTVDQCRSLLENAGQMLPYYALGMFAGLRPMSEIKRLDWSAIDWTDKVVTVRNWKGGKTRSSRYRYVNMSANLLAWLDPFRGSTGRVWPNNFQEAHQRAKREAGIQKWPHDGMRHSYASYLLALTQNSALVADQMGHSSCDMIYGSYRRLVKANDAAAFWSIYPAGWISQEPLLSPNSSRNKGLFCAERTPLEVSVW